MLDRIARERFSEGMNLSRERIECATEESIKGRASQFKGAVSTLALG